MKLGIATEAAPPRDTQPELVDPTDVWSTETAADAADDWEIEIVIADPIAVLEES